MGDDSGVTDTGPPATDKDNDGYWTPDDCDDNDPEVHPGAIEVCNGYDDDCNGIADVNDAVDAVPYYKDGDGDGYGDPLGEVATCSRPPGFVDEGTDCDDADPATNPGAAEICNDGTDNNCNGDSLECALTGDVALATAPSIWSGVAGGDQAGTSLAGVGDVNGDGLDDVMVGAPFRDGNNTDSGAAYLLLGPATGANSLANAAAVWNGVSRSDNAGTEVSGVGDVDGDGYADLIVGAIHADLGGADSGAVYLVHGPSTGTHLLSEADALLSGEISYDVAGQGLAGGGDLTGDGVLDLVIGASGQGEGSSQSHGRVYVMSGSVTGSVRLTEATATVDGLESYDRISRTAVLGDATGDGLSDLAVGGYTYPNNDGNGGAFVVAGPLAGALSLSDASATLVGEQPDDNAGYAIGAAGDVDGDGYADLLVGAPQADGGSASEAGVVYLLLGPMSSGSLADADLRIAGDEARENLGSSLAGGGDFDNDGKADLLLGAPAADTNSTDAGGAWLFYSPGGGSVGLADADLRFTAELARDAAGTSVAFVGNVNGDCCSDIGIGAIDNDRGGAGSGAIYLLGGQGL